MSERFVILHHILPDGEHWDLMLQRGETLLTWRLDADPTGPNPFPVSAWRIGEHRLAYLDYEGPVSDNRGHVTRVDTGTYELRAMSDRGCRFELRGGCLTGTFVLNHSDDLWKMTRYETAGA
jgi:hypothetical protein